MSINYFLLFLAITSSLIVHSCFEYWAYTNEDDGNNDDGTFF